MSSIPLLQLLWLLSSLFVVGLLNLRADSIRRAVNDNVAGTPDIDAL